MDIELFIEKNKNSKIIFKNTPKKDSLDSTLLKNKDNGLLPLEANSTVVLKNIYFARSKPDVLPRSFPSLQKLAETIKRRPDVIIRIEGHTDNVGSISALEQLSYRRAEAIMDYLVKAGVPSRQIQTKGFGGTRPITNNRTEEDRAKNRRVEIRVLKQGVDEK